MDLLTVRAEFPRFRPAREDAAVRMPVHPCRGVLISDGSPAPIRPSPHASPDNRTGPRFFGTDAPRQPPATAATTLPARPDERRRPVRLYPAKNEFTPAACIGQG